MAGRLPQRIIHNRGATVCFTLPTSPPIVYLVDDDTWFLCALSRRLRGPDYRVETFASAEQFLKCNLSEGTGCMVLDLQIPGPSGLELQEALA